MARYSGATRVAVLLLAGCVFSHGLFVTKAEATAKVIAVECVPQKAIEFTASPDVDSVSIVFSTECYCDTSAEKLKGLASSGQIDTARTGGGNYPLKSGDAEVTLYCYSRSMLNLGPRR
jgi:hypothetical protein